MRRRVMTVAVVAVLGASACGEEERRPANLAEGERVLRVEIDGVAAEALGDLRWTPEEPIGPQLCDTATGTVDEDASSASYGVEAPMPRGANPGAAIRTVAEEWRTRGYGEVEVEAGGEGVSAERDGMLVGLEFDPGAERAFLGGSTPCLPGRDRG